MSMENFSAAIAVRLPLRVWSMNTLPSWIVNSKSCTSLKWLSRVRADVVEFLVGGGHFLRELRDRFGRADAGDDVFALGVDEEFAVELLRAVGRVARERHAGAGVVTGVAIDHGLHVDGRSPFGGDAVLAAIDDGAVVHPRAEHGAGSAPKLLPRVLREFLAGALLDQRLETGDEFLLVGGGELRVFDVRVILLVLEAVDDHFKRLVILVLALLDAHDDVAIHLDEAAVAIPGEALVLGRGDQRQHGLVVQAQVQDRVHHAGHRVPRAGADGDQQRHGGLVAELGAHDLLDEGHAVLEPGLRAPWGRSSCSS